MSDGKEVYQAIEISGTVTAETIPWLIKYLVELIPCTVKEHREKTGEEIAFKTIQGRIVFNVIAEAKPEGTGVQL